MVSIELFYNSTTVHRRVIAFGAKVTTLILNLDDSTMVIVVEYLKFHTEEFPHLAEAGARYVVIACCGSWRDGEATSSRDHIAVLKRELRKRFMNRINRLAD